MCVGYAAAVVLVHRAVGVGMDLETPGLTGEGSLAVHSDDEAADHQDTD
jgi:hypothetical protein